MAVETSYFTQSADPEQWKQTVDYINTVLLAIDLDKVNAKPASPAEERDINAQRAEALNDARQVLSYACNFHNMRRLYTLGHLDTDALILCKQHNLLNHWQDIFDPKAAFGTADCLRKIHQAARESGATVNATQGLNYAATQQNLTPGLPYNGNLETIQPLLDMGAHAFSSYSLYVNIVAAGRKDIGRVLARHAATIGNIDLAIGMKWAREQNRQNLIADFRDLWWEYGRFHVTDPATIVETKNLQDDSRIKTVFNFASQRVTEIKEINMSRQMPHVAISEFRFDEYGSDAVLAARDKLIELGGNPPAYQPQLERKPSPLRSVTPATPRG